MSQTVKIDEAAQAAIAEIVGMPWTKSYYDNIHDEDRNCLAIIERSGRMVRVLVENAGYLADMWHFEAEPIGQAILNAVKDAKSFMKAEGDWAKSQMKRLNCDIEGVQSTWGYRFFVNSEHYEVHFTTDGQTRVCTIFNRAGMPIFQKMTEDVRSVSHDDAALVLKTFLLSKAGEDKA